MDAKIVDGLSKLLAESYTVYLKTQNYHWNVKGPQFHSLHAMFMQQYTELAEAVDVIAERIRALGAAAPGTFAQYQKLSGITQTEGVPPASDMVRELAKDQRTLVKTAQELFKPAQEAGDEATYDLLVQRVQIHEKNAWMLDSSL